MQTRQNAGRFRELEVLERLQASLPAEFEIFHELTWHAVDSQSDQHGEIDIIVLAPNGAILLIEVKAGAVDVRNGSIFKLYGKTEHDVGRQCRIQYGAIVHRLNQVGLRTFVTNCLVIPDYRIDTEVALVSLPRERIIDAQDYDVMGTRIRDMLAGRTSASDKEAIRQFLRNEFHVAIDLKTMQSQLRGAVEQLSDGLATWVPRITTPSGCVRIQATAGSGKTQLAMRLMIDAVRKKQSVLYVCFNRPLADHIARIAPTQVQVASFHELCIDAYRREKGEPDFADKTIFEKAAAHYVAGSASTQQRLNLLIVDEGQDFEPAWLEALVVQLKPDGRLYLLEDRDQRLYEREEFELTDAVMIDCNDNFRSPRAVCETINAFALSDTFIRSRNPYAGVTPGFHSYSTDAELIAQTALAIDGMLARGFVQEDIVILTSHGRAKSRLQNTTVLGGYLLRRFAGNYTPGGEPSWSEGRITVDSVFRFKGQSAPAVILAEFDFEDLTALERRKLFVGLTRACLAIDVVLSVRVEKALAAALGNNP